MPCHHSHGEHYCQPLKNLPKGSISNIEEKEEYSPPEFVIQNRMQPRGFITKNGYYNLCLYQGNTGGTITYIDGEERSMIYITDVFVSDDARRKGVGTYLLYLLAKDAQKKRFRNISLDSVLEEHNDFYERLGFRYIPDSGDNEMKVKTEDLLTNIRKNLKKAE